MGLSLAGTIKAQSVLIADPLKPNPVAQGHHYPVDIYRLICAIMPGILTYDGNLLMIEPPRGRGRLPVCRSP